jgi:hypothetical protein
MVAPLAGIANQFKSSPSVTQSGPPTMGSTRGDALHQGNAETSPYEVKQHMYPNDLLSRNKDGQSEYGGNYVVFYINIAVDSKLAKSLTASNFVDNITPRDRGDLIAQNLSTEKLAVSQTGLIVGGAVLGEALGVGKLTGSAALLAEVGALTTTTMAASASRAQRRLKTAIAMHVPNQLQIRYGMQWGDDDTLALQMATTASEQLTQAVKAGSVKGAAEQLGGPAQAIITNLALSKGPNASALSAATGMAANPKKEQIFRGVDFRSFSFDYQFFPRSPEEAQNVLNIIKTFKFHMHPEFKDDNNFIYIYPSEFDIFYYNNGVENPNIHRHTSCVLKELSVNYTPNGAFNTFDNGMPTQINLTMNFQELGLLTKDKISQGL